MHKQGLVNEHNFIFCLSKLNPCQTVMATLGALVASSARIASLVALVVLLFLAVYGEAAPDCGAKRCGTGYCFQPDPKGPPQVSITHVH